VTVADRLDRIEARFELQDLVAAYFHAVDARKFDELVSLFLPDAEFRHPGGSVRGAAALESFYREQLARWPATYHYSHAHVVELGEGTATGLVDAHAEHADEGTCVVAGLRYEDRYARDAGRWRFAARTLHIRYFLPWEKLGTSYRHSASFAAAPTALSR
jgi:hypothetical protein